MSFHALSRYWTTSGRGIKANLAFAIKLPFGAEKPGVQFGLFDISPSRDAKLYTYSPAKRLLNIIALLFRQGFVHAVKEDEYLRQI